MDDQIIHLQIRKNLTSVINRLTSYDVDEVQDRLFEKHILKDILQDFDNKGVRERLKRLLDIVFKAHACQEFVQILRECGFQTVADDIERTEIPAEELYTRSKTYVVSSDDSSSGVGNGPVTGNDDSPLVAEVSALKQTVDSLSKIVEATHINTNEMKEVINQLGERGLPASAIFAEYKMELDELKTEKAELQDKLDAEKEKFAQLQTTYKGLKQQLQEKQERLAVLTRKSSETEDVKQENKTLKKEITNLELKQQRLNGVIADRDEALRTKIDGHEQEVRCLKQEISELEEALEINTTEKEDMEKALDDQTEITKRLEDALQKRHFEIVKLQQKIKEFSLLLRKEKEEAVKGRKVNIETRPAEHSKRIRKN